MDKDTAYRLFDRYMVLTKHKYNKTMFTSDDMYFCKMFVSQYQGFADICKKYKVTQAFFILFARYEEYEHRLLKIKYDSGLINEQEYNSRKREVTNRHKRGLG